MIVRLKFDYVALYKHKQKYTISMWEADDMMI